MPHRSSTLKQMIVNVSITVLSTFGILYLGMNAYAVFRSDDLIFPAPPSSYQDDDDIFKLESSDGNQLSAYYLPSKKPGRLLLYSHGNGEDIGDSRPFLQSFTGFGISVLAYDYPGYGTSTGKASEAGCYAAIKAAYAYATKQLGYSPDQITLYGRSLGSGPSTWLAEQEDDISGLILDGAFTSTFRVMTRVKLLPWDKFDNDARLPQVTCPVLLAHGTEDQTVPFSHAQKNWEAIQSPRYKLFVEGAGHNDLVDIAGQDYWETIIAFAQGDLQ